MPFCYIDYASFTHIAHFLHHPAETRFCPFLSPLMAFEGVSCYHRTLRPLKCSTIGSCSPSIFRFPRSFLKKRRSFSKKRGRFSEKHWTFSEKRWTFSQKRGSFFFSPLREKISHSKEEQRTAGYQLPRLALVICPALRRIEQSVCTSAVEAMRMPSVP